MIGYPYIKQLFQAVIDSSKVLQGRFYVCPNWGSELANPNIEDALYIGQKPSYDKYPGAFLMPPPKQGNFQFTGQNNGTGTGLYDIYLIKILFLAGATNAGTNTPIQPNQLNKSTHTIFDTWHDMDRCAQNFLSVLTTLLYEQLKGSVILWDQNDAIPRISLATNIGNDGVSGVMMTFKLGIYSGCTIEDYPADYQTSIVLPPLSDIHPIHSL
jgi:hypothetical protein